jgi:hypothetical protein
MWVEPATTIFSASWQYIPDDAPANAGAELLGAEDIVGAEAAVAWGRKRARVVLIRLSHSSASYFSAGELAYRGEMDGKPVPAWPPADPPPNGWFTPPPESDL